MSDYRVADKRTVIVKEDGNKLVEAGDIITEEIAISTEIDRLILSPRKNETVLWAGGKPLRMTIDGIIKDVSAIRKDNSFGDMDSVLPKEILARRKRLVMDRMKQERL